MILYLNVAFAIYLPAVGGGMVNKLCSSAYFCLSEEVCQRHVGLYVSK